MSGRQGPFAASGAVLARKRMGEGGLWLVLFLKGHGLLRASAPGAERGRTRFGGGTEPFVWGAFQLHRGKGGGLWLGGVDVADDMLPLRRRPEALLMAARWSKLLIRHVIPEHPADALVADLYWNTKLLCAAHVSAEAAGWRFLWRWLVDWGLAPDMRRCAACGRELEAATWGRDGLICARHPGASVDGPTFTGEDLALLRRVAEGDVASVAGMFEEGASRAHEDVFTVASRRAEGLLSSEK